MEITTQHLSYSQTVRTGQCVLTFPSEAVYLLVYKTTVLTWLDTSWCLALQGYTRTGCREYCSAPGDDRENYTKKSFIMWNTVISRRMLPRRLRFNSRPVDVWVFVDNRVTRCSPFSINSPTLYNSRNWQSFWKVTPSIRYYDKSKSMRWTGHVKTNEKWETHTKF